MAALAGGNVRVGLEDNIYLSRGVLAGNGQLVERAVRILDAMNVRILSPDETRAQARARPALSDRPRARQGPTRWRVR